MNRPGRMLLAFGFATTIAVTASGCYVQGHARYGGGAVVAYDEPPPPREEPYNAQPGYVWIHGRWDWQGGQWVWIAGHPERERAGYQWTEGRWEQRGNQWHYNEGAWIVANGVEVHATEQSSGGVYADHTVVDRNGQPLGGGATMYPSQPPPPVQVESPGNRPGYLWVQGYYQWGNGQYQWTPGHWERERANMMWQPGRWEARGNEYYWVEGSWVQGGGGNRDHRHP
jgi:hypothetical protein